jgi:hypothetical protein
LKVKSQLNFVAFNAASALVITGSYTPQIVSHFATLTTTIQSRTMITIPMCLFVESIATSQFILYILGDGGYHFFGTMERIYTS